MSLPLNQTAVVGIGQTEFSKSSGRSELQLAAEASRSAIVDACLEPSDIEGMVTFQRGNTANLNQVFGILANDTGSTVSGDTASGNVGSGIVLAA